MYAAACYLSDDDDYGDGDNYDDHCHYDNNDDVYLKKIGLAFH